MLSLRPATASDRDFFFRLRADPVTVRYSRTRAPIFGESHDRWYAAALLDAERALFVAVHRTTLVGTGRLVHEPAGTEVSLIVAPEWRGRGHGTALVTALVSEAARRGWVPVRAEVRPENAASLKAFQRAGFRQAGLVRLEWTP